MSLPYGCQKNYTKFLGTEKTFCVFFFLNESVKEKAICNCRQFSAFSGLNAEVFPLSEKNLSLLAPRT